MPDSLCVLTYNIRTGRGADEQRSIERIADVINASGADIACLQEVAQWTVPEGFGDQPEQLAAMLGMKAEFLTAHSTEAFNFGDVILSRYPIMQVQRQLLTSVGEQRGLIQARIGTNLGEITVFCTHWGLNREERSTQAVEAAVLVEECATPVVFCGDLNDTPDSPPVRRFIENSRLHDLAAQAGVIDLTFPSDTPKYRIDYIFGSHELAACEASVIRTLASDHRPVSVTITLAS